MRRISDLWQALDFLLYHSCHVLVWYELVLGSPAIMSDQPSLVRNELNSKLNRSNFQDQISCGKYRKIFYATVHEPKLWPVNGIRDVFKAKPSCI